MTKLDPEVITAVTPAIMIVVAGVVTALICYAPVSPETKAIALGFPIATGGAAGGALQNRKPDFSVKQRGSALDIQTPGDETSNDRQ